MFLKSIYLWCIHYFLGKLFQQLITCSEKKVQFCISGTVTVNELFAMPTIQLLVAIWKHVDTGLMENPCIILYTSTKSALLHLSPKDCRFMAFSLASYVMTLSSGNSLVKQCWTLSSMALSYAVVGIPQSWGLESETRDCSQTRVSVFETCDLLATCP